MTDVSHCSELGLLACRAAAQPYADLRALELCLRLTTARFAKRRRLENR